MGVMSRLHDRRGMISSPGTADDHIRSTLGKAPRDPKPQDEPPPLLPRPLAPEVMPLSARRWGIDRKTMEIAYDADDWMSAPDKPSWRVLSREQTEDGAVTFRVEYQTGSRLDVAFDPPRPAGKSEPQPMPEPEPEPTPLPPADLTLAELRLSYRAVEAAYRDGRSLYARGESWRVAGVSRPPDGSAHFFLAALVGDGQLVLRVPPALVKLDAEPESSRPSVPSPKGKAAKRERERAQNMLMFGD